MISYNDFFENFRSVAGRMEKAATAAGRSAGEIAVLPVTKTFPVDAVDYARRAGLLRVGENRVQEAVAKKTSDRGDPPVAWDLIGHLQSNKASVAVECFDRIQSVDSLKLAKRLDRLAAEAGRRMPCLLQVNSGADPRKYGFLPGEIEPVVDGIAGCRHLAVEGLMTIGPLEGGRDAARRAFAELREIRDVLRSRTGLALDELSMGMSGDLEEAIAEGSTLVRLGSALFGERESGGP